RDPEARAAYEQTLLRIEALAILYRQLHESGTGTHVDVVRYLDELSETVTDSQPGAARGVTIEIAAEPVQAGLYEAMPLGLIVVELLTTSLRHAFPSEGWVRLTLTRTGDKLARLEIADNGRALPAGFDEDMDTGMMLVEALAGQLGDGLNTESTPHGSAASFTFPVWN
ncbi:MAG TPA: sensor histidine kinase, partial [Azospirillaceae bacterium]|nr:sensor histidine kinase [Azospirillaceae bacterium]